MERATFEIKKAFEWYEDKSTGLGKRFSTEVKDACKIIQKQPDRYPLKFGDHREMYIKTFPFIVIYQVDEENKEILITSVFHTKRNPENKY